MPFLWGAGTVPTMSPEAFKRDAPGVHGAGHANACRLGLDWAAVEPRPGLWDGAVLASLRQSLVSARTAGLEPLLTLHRGRDPRWFREQQGWRRGDAVQLFCRYVVKVVEEVGDLVTLYVTVDGPTTLAPMCSGDRVGARAREPDTAWSTSPAARRVLRALLHAHGASRWTLREATPRHGPRPVGAPLAGIAHHMRAFTPRHAGSVLDRMATGAADYYANWLPLRVLHDGRIHAPLGHGQYLPELDDAHDFLGMTPAPRGVVSWVGGSYPDVEIKPRATATALPDGPTVATLLRRAATLNKPLLLLTTERSDQADEGALLLQRSRLGAIVTARAAGVPVGGYVSGLALE
ncbi:MAG: hypothetical protein NVSMB65_02050 [Chloroflexota bacterium]